MYRGIECKIYPNVAQAELINTTFGIPASYYCQ
ncbi:helix-turn-helix domain-containing protein [Salinicoccus sp. HZC-1]